MSDDTTLAADTDPQLRPHMGDGPGRLDVHGTEWWATDPYPTWFRWQGPTLITADYNTRWADGLTWNMEPQPECPECKTAPTRHQWGGGDRCDTCGWSRPGL